LRKIIFKSFIRDQIFGEIGHEEDEMRNSEQDERHTLRIDICAENFSVNARLNYFSVDILYTFKFRINF